MIILLAKQQRMLSNSRDHSRVMQHPFYPGLKTTTTNPDKFQAIVLGMKHPETLNFLLGNITIKPEDKVTLLGIDLDSKAKLQLLHIRNLLKGSKTNQCPKTDIKIPNF